MIEQFFRNDLTHTVNVQRIENPILSGSQSAVTRVLCRFQSNNLPERASMKKSVIITVIAILMISGVAAYHYLTSSRNDGMLELSGTVEVTEVNVGFKMPGRITGLHTEEGQRVGKGERLAVLDSAELRSIVEQGRAAVRNAEAEYEKARKDFDRYRALFQEGAVTAQQLDAARKAHDVALSQVDQARAALRTAEVRLKDTVADSPVSGIVLSKNVEQGETVAAGVAVYSLGDLDNPWVKVYVNETKLGLEGPDLYGHLSGESIRGEGHLYRIRGRVHAQECPDQRGKGQTGLRRQGERDECEQ
jgi:multidrug resistance efflux pump